MSRLTLATTVLAALCGLEPSLLPSSSARAETIPVSFDRWMYPFNGTPGTRATGSTFAAVGAADFDDRDAQVLLGFNTSSIGPVPSGHKVSSVVLRVTIAAEDTFRYDPTYDGYRTYLDIGDPDFLNDIDAGRPMELYGVGTRNGFTEMTFGTGTSSSFAENSDFSTNPILPFGFGPPRSAFASDYAGGLARDVSNNVEERFDPTPWAIGQTSAVAPGALVPIDTVMTFTLDLSNPFVAAYVAHGINGGGLFFALSSLHGASLPGEGDPSYPSIYQFALNGASLGDTATLEIQFAPVPEPATWMLAAMGIGLLMYVGKRRIQVRLHKPAYVPRVDREK